MGWSLTQSAQLDWGSLHTRRKVDPSKAGTKAQSLGGEGGGDDDGGGGEGVEG